MADKDVYLKNDSGDTLLPASDWNILQNKPSNLVTSDMMPTATGWMTDGIAFENGAYDWDHGTTGANTCYRYIDFGSFKLVELNAHFAFNKNLPKGQEIMAIQWPDIIKPDSRVHSWFFAGEYATYIDDWDGPAGHNLWVYFGTVGTSDADTLPANSELSMHKTYITTA